MNGLALSYLCDLFNKRAQLHDRDTRNKESLHIPLCNTASGQRREVSHLELLDSGIACTMNVNNIRLALSKRK